MLYNILYLAFNCAYVLAGGHDPYGDDYIYSIFDWNNDIVTAIGVSIGCVMLQFVGYLLIGAFLKKVVLSEYLRASAQLEMETELAEQIENNEEMDKEEERKDDGGVRINYEDEKDKEYMDDLEAVISSMGTQRGTKPSQDEKEEEDYNDDRKGGNNGKHGVGVSGVSSVLDVDEIGSMEEILDGIPEDDDKGGQEDDS